MGARAQRDPPIFKEEMFVHTRALRQLDEVLTKWMNPAAVNQVLRMIDNSLENFTELLGGERQGVGGFRQVPEPHKCLTCYMLILQVWFLDQEQWYVLLEAYQECRLPGPTLTYWCALLQDLLLGPHTHKSGSGSQVHCVTRLFKKFSTWMISISLILYWQKAVSWESGEQACEIKIWIDHRCVGS